MKIRLTVLIIGFLGFTFLTLAQTKEQLERERKKIIQEIEKTNKFLETTTKSKNTTLKDIKAISSQVDNRKKLINTISGEITNSDKKIIYNNNQIDSLTKNLARLNKQYIELQRYTYLRSLSNNKWSYLLSSENLNTFLLRWRYGAQFESFNEKKKIEIASLQNKISNSTQEIIKVKEEKNKLLLQETQAATLLEKEKQQKDKMLKDITQKEAGLMLSLQKQKNEREKLNKSIERIITEQLRVAREIASAPSGNNKSKEKNLDNTNVKLADEFSQNKNKLPWPISSGFVSSRFGVQAHESLKGVTVENNGIDITARGSKEVKSVFEGEVVGVTKVPGNNYMIIVRHGNYYSVYSNLVEVYVKQGTKTTIQQSLGRVEPDEDGNSELHFELWRDKTKMNPESWLR
jgi:septal ring factor EnvC (AmiA/AmiB activator)